ncbi:uncharacterized protein TNCV_750931 [Trichonephila clavipes]|nr:uncharacterized protein TNCV_750931 [Trichonephila clavipes]
MAPHTITPAVGAVCRCKAKAGLTRSPRGIYTRTRLSSLLRLNLDSSLKTTWFHSTAVQFSRAWPHSKRRRRWVGVKGSTRNRCCDPKCLSARHLCLVREDSETPSEGATYVWMAADETAFFSNVRLEKLNTVVKKDTSAIGNYILVDFNQVNNLLRSAKCQYCEKQTLKLELGAKLGFSYNLKLLCSNCDENKTVVNTSLKSVQTSHDVNLRITQAFSHIGKGYSAIEKFCMVMNIDPFSSTTYGKCARRLDNAYTLASENIFAEIHREIKNVYENGAEITDLSVSFDGTWLTRGHTSLIGVGCVIDMLTGYVVDFEVMSKVCRHCSVAKIS